MVQIRILHNYYYYVFVSLSSNKAGSVVAQATTVFLPHQTNSILIKFMFMGAIGGRNEINGLKINRDFIQGKRGQPLTYNLSYKVQIIK